MPEKNKEKEEKLPVLRNNFFSELSIPEGEFSRIIQDLARSIVVIRQGVSEISKRPEDINILLRMIGFADELRIISSKKSMREYLTDFQKSMGDLLEQNSGRANIQNTTFLVLMRDIIAKARTGGLLEDDPVGGDESVIIIPKKAIITFENNRKELELQEIFRESLKKITTKELMMIQSKMTQILWLYEGGLKRKELEEVSQVVISIFIEALSHAIETEIGEKSQREDGTFSRYLKQNKGGDEEPKKTVDSSVPPYFAGAIIHCLGGAETGTGEQAKLEERYSKDWKRRGKEMSNILETLESAIDNVEAEANLLLEACVPAGMDQVDFFEGSYYVRALARSAIKAGADQDSTSILHALMNSSLKKTVSVNSKVFGEFKAFESHVAMRTLPGGLTILNHTAKKVLIDRILLGANRFNPFAYYKSGGNPKEATSDIGIDALDMWYMFYEIKKMMKQEKEKENTIIGFLGRLLPGVPVKSLISLASSQRGRKSSYQLILQDRFKMWGEATGQYFSAIQQADISIMMRILFMRLANCSYEEWHSEEWFEHITNIALGENTPKDEEHEKKIEEMMMHRYRSLSEPMGRVAWDKESAKEIGSLLGDWRKKDVSLRLIILGHVARLDPRISQMKERVFIDIENELPYGQEIDHPKHFRVFSECGGKINMTLFKPKESKE